MSLDAKSDSGTVLLVLGPSIAACVVMRAESVLFEEIAYSTLPSMADEADICFI